MNPEILKERIQTNGKIVPKRCSEKWLRANGLYGYIMTAPEDFESITEKITFLIHGGGYCGTCGKRTSRADMGFRKFCSNACGLAGSGFSEARQALNDSARVKIDRETITRLYVDERMPVLQMSQVLGVSNVTIHKIMRDYGIDLRDHSETQSERSGTKGIREYDHPREWWEAQYKEKSTNAIACELGCSPSLVIQRMEELGIARDGVGATMPENSIADILNEFGVRWVRGERVLIAPYEIDVLCPDHNIGIEINGAHWHSERYGRGEMYHVRKTNACASVGIRLYHFWDYEIYDKSDIVRGMLLSAFGKTTRIGARKCSVARVIRQDADAFFDANHIQGKCNHADAFGLYLDGELVSCMAVGKPRFDANHDLELIRFATKIGFTVSGGFSRLLKCCDGSIVSYANRRYSVGNVYERSGFRLIGESRPSYNYVKGRSRRSRYACQKHKLVNEPGYDDALSEREIMEANGWHRAWDCGNLVYSRS